MTLLTMQELAAIETKLGSGGLQPCFLEIRSGLEDFGVQKPDPEIFFAWLEGFAPRQGWLWRAGAPVWFRSFDEVPRDGLVLEAQFTVGDVATVEVQHQGGGRWATRTLTEWAVAGEGREEMLAEKCRFLSANKAFEAFVYRRYWRCEPDGLVRQAAARFIGYD